MAYRSGGSDKINDNLEAGVFKNVTVKNYYTFDNVDVFQGSTSGYSSGGNSPAPATYDVIEKFPFATNANAVDVGDLTLARHLTAGQSSSANGYISGGSAFNYSNTIDKFPFAYNVANAADVGDLTQIRGFVAGQSSATSGYTTGGFAGTLNTYFNTIDKFSFSADDNATDVGDLTEEKEGSAGQSSSNHGYVSGGKVAPPTPAEVNTIEKFPFAIDTNSTDVGDLTQSKTSVTGTSSTVSGYTSGGSVPTFGFNVIDKFPFSSDGNAADVGDLSGTRIKSSSQSSTANGYIAGGWSGSQVENQIQNFPFATDTNASDVGDLLAAKQGVSGQQV